MTVPIIKSIKKKSCRGKEALSEASLVRFAQEGDHNAFQELASRTRESCLRIACSILKNRDDAEDEVQNAMWKAWTQIHLFNRESTFATWLTRIVINHCLMRYRRVRRMPFVSYFAMGSDGEWYAAYNPSTIETPEQGLGQAELQNLLQIELRHIPILLRRPLELRFVHDLPLDETARRLGITVAATKSRLHRAQLYLRERMVKHCGYRGVATLTRVA
jgi:RNA polymerase sigma-70 factor (ECF subfamily)